MKQRGVLCPLKFEKACSRKDLRAFMLLYRFMKSGQILPIPNFIVFSISLKCLDFQGLPESGAFGLRHFRMDLYARKPCLIQIAAQPDPRIQMWHGRICPSLFLYLRDQAAFAAPSAASRIQLLLWRRYVAGRAYKSAWSPLRRRAYISGYPSNRLLYYKSIHCKRYNSQMEKQDWRTYIWQWTKNRGNV